MYQGLTAQDVQEQIEKGNVNVVSESTDKTLWGIIKENLFTYFNAIFLIITILLIIGKSYNSLTFLPAIIANIFIGIIQQIRAKHTLEKLSILDKTSYATIRDNRKCKVPSDELVLGDLIVLRGGQQIPADAEVVNGMVSVNESLLTGEADEVEKKLGDELKSGSFVVSGACYAKLTQVGKESYAAKLMARAKEVKDKKSEMIRDIELIIKVAGILIIPVGAILFYQAYAINHESFKECITSAVAAVIGMIPEGMYLLTTIALALSSIRLARNKVMLHDMRSIETLARTDVLCVDKTGTITTNKMYISEVFVPAGIPETKKKHYEDILAKYVSTVNDNNITAEALKEHFGKATPFENAKVVAFSSKNKYSQVQVGETLYRLGAPDILLFEELFEDNRVKIEEHTGKGERVVTLVEENATGLRPVLFVSIVNELRKNAKEIFQFFNDNEVEIKVISGDNPMTVSRIAEMAGIANADKYVDAGELKTKMDYKRAVDAYAVFGRVKPEQKKMLVRALKKKGKSVAMTGDGVNDILAMKEADCSISMGSGSDAARNAAQVVLLDDDFSHMKQIVGEGRRDINNISRSATLFLYKNMFSLFLAIFAIINVFPYPLQPSQVALVSAFNIGMPAFLLALEPNEKKQKGSFIASTLIRALPAAITSFISIAGMVLFAQMFKISDAAVGTASTYLLSVVGFIILWNMIQPTNRYRVVVLVISFLCMLLSIIFLPSLFSITGVSLECGALCLVFAIAEVTVMRWLTNLIEYIRHFRVVKVKDEIEEEIEFGE